MIKYRTIRNTKTKKKDFSMKKKKLYLFDIDGTLAIGDTLYKGSRDLLEYIKSIDGKAYFITNNSTKSGQDYVDKFKKSFSLKTKCEDFVTSGMITLRFLKEHYSNKLIYVLGTSSFIDELRKNGLYITEHIDSEIACIVVAYDNELNYNKLTIASEILETMDVPYYATNPDLRCPIDFGFVPDCGSICDMLKSTTDRTPIYLGKPNREMVDYCIRESGFAKEETIVVGDRLYTDIACGINAEVDTALVLTGEAKIGDLQDTSFLPTIIYETIYDMYLSLI